MVKYMPPQRNMSEFTMIRIRRFSKNRIKMLAVKRQQHIPDIIDLLLDAWEDYILSRDKES